MSIWFSLNAYKLPEGVTAAVLATRTLLELMNSNQIVDGMATAPDGTRSFILIETTTLLA